MFIPLRVRQAHGSVKDLASTATTAAQLLVSCVVVLGMTTTASASIEFAVNKDTTATGVRLTAVKAKDHTTCQNTCNGRSDCKAYSFAYQGKQKGRCTLFRSISKQTPDKSFHVGTRRSQTQRCVQASKTCSDRGDLKEARSHVQKYCTDKVGFSSDQCKLARVNLALAAYEQKDASCEERSRNYCQSDEVMFSKEKSVASSEQKTREACEAILATPQVLNDYGAYMLQRVRPADAKRKQASAQDLREFCANQVGFRPAFAPLAICLTPVGVPACVKVGTEAVILVGTGVLAVGTLIWKATTRPRDEVDEAPRFPNQTCSNAELDALSADVDQLCKASTFPGLSCNPNKTSEKRLAKLACSDIKARLLKQNACLTARQLVQTRCFNGQPDPGHQTAIDQMSQGIQACIALAAVNCAPGHPMADK